MHSINNEQLTAPADVHGMTEEACSDLIFLTKAAMERSVAIALGIFVTSVWLLSYSSNTAASFYRPAESLSIILVTSGAILLITSFLTSSFAGKPSASESQNENISLPKPGSLSTEPLEKLQKLSLAKLRETWVVFALTIALLAARIELHGYLVRHVRCSALDAITIVPFVISLYEYWSSKQKGNFRSGDTIRKPFSYICPCLLLIAAGLVIRSLRNGWESSIICPIVTNERRMVLWLQVLRGLLDSAIAIAAEVSAKSSIRRSNGAPWQVTTTWGLLLVGSAVFWEVGKIGSYFLPGNNKESLSSTFSSSRINSLITHSLVMSMLLMSAGKCIINLKALTLSFVLSILTAREAMVSSMATAMMHSYPSMPFLAGLLAITLLHSAGYLYLRPAIPASPDPFLFPAFIFRFLFIISIIQSLSWTVFQERVTPQHPINVLMTNARQEHAQWLAEAKHSSNLQEAVSEYKERYGLLPPPGFDIWYEYATNRSSLIIDNYDQIHRDLLPFRALAPSTLRDLTNSMTSNQWNDIAAVVIRGGVAEPQPEIKPTHRWMVEGIVQMIAPFASYLPDMDIGFNINDECRVSVPWDTIQSMNNTARSQLSPLGTNMTGVWSKDRSLSWALSHSNDQQTHIHFTEHSRRDTFHSLVAKACPPGSKARTEYQWQHDTLCLSCAAPHSMEQFLQDWELSGNACHQPDLANLHGFFISPSAFKVSETLIPVFSQSKVSGFNDILYPSSWNYVEKAKYNPSDEHPDPPYDRKEATLFWRGTTSEGYSETGSWKGMARQRLLHMSNNNTNHVSVLLPSSNEDSFTYNTITPSTASRSLGLNPSVGIAEGVARCGQKDCGIQRHELGITSRVEFDDHWKYRFLFDLDGAGFSGRFLPFLQSNSLPFRTAIFRQWFDTRLTPWLHFVPQDIRFHDMWSTLAYFSGAKTVDENGKATKILMEPHDREGKIIAREGKKWAEETLRKEDMEIYLFRLLLEWGRLTDDRRDELGFGE
ncbi:hypothetical protein FQN49_003432 [Arthroderma sp. PD_2]|nr:hypothetical protein FQN49_003432 [Arthroderma sp. PD_2]